MSTISVSASYQLMMDPYGNIKALNSPWNTGGLGGGEPSASDGDFSAALVAGGAWGQYDIVHVSGAVAYDRFTGKLTAEIDSLELTHNGRPVLTVSGAEVEVTAVSRLPLGLFLTSDDSITGSLLDDVIYGLTGDDAINGRNGNDILVGGWGNDTILGGSGDDALTGSFGDDFLAGQWGRDALNGGAGNDVIFGGFGADILTGGAGYDAFRFDSFSDSTKIARDVITDFKRGVDVIDLSRMDANTRVDGDQAFTFVDTHYFSGHAGELRFKAGVLLGDVNGDAKADFAINIQKVWTMTDSDFVL